MPLEAIACFHAPYLFCAAAVRGGIGRLVVVVEAEIENQDVTFFCRAANEGDSPAIQNRKGRPNP